MASRLFCGSAACVFAAAFSASFAQTAAPAAAAPAPYSGQRPQSIKDGVQIQTAYREDVVAMEDSLPRRAPVKPSKPRKLLVLCKASGFVHSSIPLAAETVKEMGDTTGAYTTTITYDAADIAADNLKQYDAIVLDSTTLSFLDDAKDPAVTEARRKALLDVVRGGKGLVGIHAAIESYQSPPPYSKDKIAHGIWPEFNQMMGGYFKYHWPYPQAVTVKIDDPQSQLTAMFHGQEFTIHDEIYTLALDSFSRRNVHVLTSVDYAKMSAEDKAKEVTPRTDGDYALSWIHREGQGRVFIEMLGHSEHVYAMTRVMEHLLAGIQYALGDLKADDRPSER